MAKEAHQPLDVLWQARTLVWVLLVVLGLALVLAVGRDATSLAHRFEQFGLFALIGYWIALLALGGLYLLRRRLARADPVRVAWIAVAMLLGATWLSCAIMHWVAAPLVGDNLGSLTLRATVIALTVGIISLGAFEAVWRNLQLRSAARRAELAALQARVHPHFLFNTINTAIALLRQQPDLAERLLHDLSDLFRAALSSERDIPLAQELDLCRRYLEIESLRLGDRLRVRWEQPEALPDLAVPVLLIQPLVENAVRHGIEPLAHGGELAVAVHCTRDEVVIEIVNPFAPGSPRLPGHRVGQSAIRALVAQRTRERGRFETAQVDGRYLATIALPLDER